MKSTKVVHAHVHVSATLPSAPASMAPRPQPRTVVSATELAACARVVGAWAPAPASPSTSAQLTPPIVLSYATSPPPRRWLLGLTAAFRGWPIVLAGQGHAGFTYKTLSVPKVFGLRRALQVIHHLRPASLVLIADAGDTVLLSAFSPADASLAASAVWRAHERVVRGGDASLSAATAASEAHLARTVIAQAECASFPKCFDALYVAASSGLPRLRACLASKPTCYGNSGAFLGRAGGLHGTFEGMVRLHVRWSVALAAAAGPGEKPPQTLRGVAVAPGVTGDVGKTERLEDQALFNMLFVNQLAENVSIVLDSDSDAFLSTRDCRGAPSPGNVTKQRKFVGPFGTCHRRPWAPLNHLLPPPAAAAAAQGGARPPALLGGIRFRAPDGVVRWPLLLHANGLPKRGIPFAHGRKPKQSRELLYAVEKAIKDALGEGEAAEGRAQDDEALYPIERTRRGAQQQQQEEEGGQRKRAGVRGGSGADASVLLHPKAAAAAATPAASSPSPFLRHPVLLVDSVGGGPCAMSRLGAVLAPPARNRSKAIGMLNGTRGHEAERSLSSVM